MSRDILAHPYSTDEQKVVDWLIAQTPGIGAGPDPIGFLIALYGFLRPELVAAQKKIATLESLLKPPDGWTVIEATIVLFRAPYSRNHTLRSGTVAEPVDLAEMLTDAMESARKRSGAGG